MYWMLIFTVVLSCVTPTTSKPMSKPMFPQICHKIRTGGCPSELKRTGRVCGTDGNTYRNACILSWQACTLRFNLRFAHYGPCDQEDWDEEEGIIGQYLEGRWEQNNPSEDPDTSSSSSEEDIDTGVGGGAGGPAGGGAGVPPVAPTAGGAPVTDNAAGGGGVTIGVATTVTNGAEVPAVTTIVSVPEVPRIPVTDADVLPPLVTDADVLPPLVIDADVLPRLAARKCARKCPDAQKSNIVCGTDNRQYQSPCHLTQYACVTNSTISVAHRGYCNNTCAAECPRVYEPVCGTDGLTYKFSRCDIERTACLIRDDTLRIAYNGECIETEPVTKCPVCDLIAAPVCSSNNITFRSECEFNRYVCFYLYRDNSIEIASNDSCSHAPLVCLNFCEPIDDPVCGSNGKTYPNVCELGLADCHARNVDPLWGIQFACFGPCVEITTDPCSRNSPECDLHEAPVCGMVDNEMVSFYNMCFYQKEVCFDPTIMYIGEGLCPPALELPNLVNQP